jgi:hypothetical protein
VSDALPPRWARRLVRAQTQSAPTALSSVRIGRRELGIDGARSRCSPGHGGLSTRSPAYKSPRSPACWRAGHSRQQETHRAAADTAGLVSSSSPSHSNLAGDRSSR